MEHIELATNKPEYNMTDSSAVFQFQSPESLPSVIIFILKYVW